LCVHVLLSLNVDEWVIVISIDEYGLMMTAEDYYFNN